MQCAFSRRDARPRRRCWPLILGIVLLVCACQTKEAPLSPGAAAFKKEVKQCLVTIATPLVEPLLKNDLAAISAVLEKVEPQAIKLCRMCPFRIGVLNGYGEALAVHPPRRGDKRDFSDYNLVIKTINTRRIQQQRFFLQNGSQIYIICVPIFHEDNVIGLVAIVINAEEAQQRWGLTDQEFLSVNFNE